MCVELQAILFEIDCAIFYTNLQELLCQFQVSVGSYDLFTGTIDGVNNMLVKNLECCFLRQIY